MRDEDRLMQELAEAARSRADEQGSWDGTWEALCRGGLSDEESAALRRRAADHCGVDAMHGAFAPLDEAERAAITDRLLGTAARAQRAAGTDPQPRPAWAPRRGRWGRRPARRRVLTLVRQILSPDRVSPARDAAGCVAPPQRSSRSPSSSRLGSDAPSSPKPYPSFRTVGLGAAAALAALAAGVLLVLVPLTGPEPPSPLPPYVLELGAGVQALRSGGPDAGPPRPPVLVPGATLALNLLPAERVSGEVVVRFFVRRGSQTQPLDLPAQVAPSGAVRVRARVGREVHLPPGELVILAAVCPAGHAPAPAGSKTPRGGPDPCRWTEARLRVLPQAP